MLFLGLCIALLVVSCQEDEPFSDDFPNNEIPNNSGNNGNNGNNNPPTGRNINNQIALERMLFWDPILSGKKDVACVTCHHPNFGYADGRALSIGVGSVGLGPSRVDNVADDIGLVMRNSPTVINTAFNGMDENGNFDPVLAPMFWDNRATSLESQALLPLHSFEQMRGHAFEESVTLDSIVARLNAIPTYQNLFANAFDDPNPINYLNIGAAIAAFERTITAMDSPFDRFQAGDESAMTPAQIRGMNRFN